MPFYNPFRRRLKWASAPLLPSVLALALAVTGCSQDGPPPLPPVSEEALSAVVVEPGVSRERLARAVDVLFDNDAVGDTHAFILMRNGEVVVERYAEDYDAQTVFLGWSLSKNLSAVLTGILVAEGRLALDEPVPIDGWQRTGDPRGAITPRHLLQMRSGLRHERASDPAYASAGDRLLLLEGRDNMAAWAMAQPLEAAEGTQFQYSDASIMILNAVATDLLAPDASADARQAAMAEFVEDRLAVPLGMESLVGEYDASGTLIGASHMWASARDWATFGEFLRNRGAVEGAQVVPRQWVDFMASPSPASAIYGGTLWLNRNDGDEASALLPGRGAETIYGGIGRFGQFVMVSPEQGLVLVRMGKTERPEREALGEAMADIFALYPDR